VESDGYAFQIELALRAHAAGFRVVEIPITFVERTDGESKMSRAIVAEALWRVPTWATLSRNRPTAVDGASVAAGSRR
jgi:dolichol-phosphate mannosyltransferase